MEDFEGKFILHPQLKKDTFFIGALELSDILLMNDCRYPWIIIVPRKANVSDITDLPEKYRQILWEEINSAASLLKRQFQPERLNIAMLGNIVPQLHCHIIARFKTDFAWAKPVWGIGETIAYSKVQRTETIGLLQKLFFNEKLPD